MKTLKDIIETDSSLDNSLGFFDINSSNLADIKDPERIINLLKEYLPPINSKKDLLKAFVKGSYLDDITVTYEPGPIPGETGLIQLGSWQGTPQQWGQLSKFKKLQITERESELYFKRLYSLGYSLRKIGELEISSMVLEKSLKSLQNFTKLKGDYVERLKIFTDNVALIQSKNYFQMGCYPKAYAYHSQIHDEKLSLSTMDIPIVSLLSTDNISEAHYVLTTLKRDMFLNHESDPEFSESLMRLISLKFEESAKSIATHLLYRNFSPTDIDPDTISTKGFPTMKEFYDIYMLTNTPPEIQQDRVEGDAFLLATTLFLENKELKDITRYVNKVFNKFKPIKNIEIYDGNIQINLNSGRHRRMIPFFNRHVNQDVSMYMNEILIDGKWSGFDELMKENYENSKENKSFIMKELKKNLEKDIEVPLETLTELWSKIHLETPDKGMFDIKSNQYSSDIIRKTFSDYDQFVAEHLSFNHLSTNPVIKTPLMKDCYMKSSCGHLELQNILGFKLDDVIQELNKNDNNINMQIRDALLDKHLLDLVFIQNVEPNSIPSIQSQEKNDNLEQYEKYHQKYGYIMRDILHDIMKRHRMSYFDDTDEAKNVRNIGVYLTKQPRFNYRDASLFNSIVDYHNILVHLNNNGLKVPDELFYQLPKTTKHKSYQERLNHVSKINSFIRENIGNSLSLDEITSLFSDNLVQIDFGSLHKTCFQLEDFIMAVDNPFTMLPNSKIDEFANNYKEKLKYILNRSVDNFDNVLSLGSFYRHIKMYNYLEKGHLDFGERIQNFKDYSLKRAYESLRRHDKNLPKLNNGKVTVGGLIDALAHMDTKEFTDPKGLYY